MSVLRRPLKIGSWLLVLLLLLQMLQAYNQVILEFFNFMLDDSLVNPRTMESVENVHDEVFLPVVLPRLGLVFVVLILARLALRRIR